ncbi:MAG: hypothetical protein WBP79_01700 [Candidatus Acidiferrales bacterium]
MNIKRMTILFAIFAFLAVPQLGAQQPADAKKSQPQNQNSMGGMDMDDMHHDGGAGPETAHSANDAMSGHHMDMGAHMFMTDLRPENPADDKRAAELVVTLRKSIDKYKDYKVALADGFQIFMPNVEQEHYHFTNYRYALEASFDFNPEHPTSLLYKKTSNGYELEGAMYTAPKRAKLDELNERVPLSVARWHKHVNLCLPPKGAQMKQADWKEFGLRGTIATEEACSQAGGRWIPQIFGWMVHIYPYETDPQKIFAH